MILPRSLPVATVATVVKIEQLYLDASQLLVLMLNLSMCTHMFSIFLKRKSSLWIFLF